MFPTPVAGIVTILVAGIRKLEMSLPALHVLWQSDEIRITM